MRLKVLLDTDIGSDIDDAVCLAYLLANPECELVGITTVSGEAEKRAMIASALCTEAEKGVPIVPGAEKPLVVPQRQGRAPQAVKLGAWKHETSFPARSAVDFMAETIRQSPHEVHLIAIGPMTNVALLLQTDPETAELLASLTLMLGKFTAEEGDTQPVEWNALCDPHAAAIVYGAPVKRHRSVGLDVTGRVVMSAREVREKLQPLLLSPVLDFAEVWFEQAESIVFHDPLAAATLFDESICGFERGKVEVRLEPPELAGKTMWAPGADGGHEVATRVDPTRFFDHFNSRLPVEEQ
jgi:purine nucleosidase